MKKLVLNSLKFAIVLATITGLNIMMNYQLNRQEVEVPKNIVATGDSHLMTGLNPEFCPTVENYSQSSEPYLMSFLKLRKIIRDNPSVNTVLLSFAHHNLSSYYDNKLLTNEAVSIFSNNIQLVTKSDLDGVSYSTQYLCRSFIKKQCLYPLFGKREYLGRHRPYSETLGGKSNLEKTIEKHFYINGNVHDFSEDFNLQYLNKIVQLCSDKKIKFVLVRTPTTIEYYMNIPDLYKKKFKNILAIAMSENVEVFNPGFEGFSEDCFKDYSHLNSKGARVFSKKLNEFLLEEE